MASIKNIQIYLYIFLLNFFFSNSILEIPIQTIKVKDVPKYQNISKIKQGQKILINNQVFYYEEGDTVISYDLLFLANIKIGSNSQEFNLILDTGSNLLWVAIQGCSGDHKISNFFIPSDSKTCTPTGDHFTMEYGTGKIEGYIYSDNVQYISSDDFNMYFGVVSTANFPATGADGIIGLSKSYDEGQKPLSFIYMLKNYGITDSLAFSFKFEMDTFASDVKGKMYIGRHDDFSKSEVKSCPLIKFENDQKIFWECEMSSLSLKGSNDEVNSAYTTNIIFDTGTNMIYLPTKYLDDLKNYLSNFGCLTYPNSGAEDKYILCDAYMDVPDINFVFNNQILTIPKEYAFHYGSNNKRYVWSNIKFTDNNPPIMGSVFFFVYHTLFDEENNELKFILNDGKIGGLSTFVIILIVIASIAVVLLIAYIIYYCIKKRKESLKTLNQNYGGDYNQNLIYTNY